ncbi:ATP-binding protein [Paenibacillus sp. SGZ-1009]|uniref:ATP-binding protein n=1 Tax=Paenibacillus campi TaxID=3106031 RepID=UPI002AFEFA18|nr:ATP-binding protein [Paenibacillus sp. SGZ-1009]
MKAMTNAEHEIMVLRKTIEDLSHQIIQSKHQEQKTLSEFSAMNNELVNLQHLLAKSNAELSEAREEAELANQARARFLAIMTHEIRTPMNGVIGMAEMLMSSELTEEQKRSVMLIQESAELLLSMINNMLDLSKMEAGKMQLQEGVINMRLLLDHIVRLIEPKANEHDNAISTFIDYRVKSDLIGDGGRIRQILLNLINNANKFTRNGKIEISVQLKENRANLQILHIEVSDTGIGIAPDQQQKLFQPYAQAQRPEQHGMEGTGLGLSICKSLVELMEGTIDLRSDEGKGSVFWFDIPLKKNTTAQAQPEYEQERTTGQRHGNKSNTPVARVTDQPILIVEDNPINSQVIQLQLKKMGMSNVHMAINGQEAFDVFLQHEYVLVLMDNRMPIMDGFQATRKIRELERMKLREPVPIIALTANTSPEDRQRCLEVGMDDILTKPVNLESLTRILHKWLPAAAMTEKALDMNVIQEIIELNEEGDPEVLRTLIDMYQNETPAKLERLQRLASERNLKGLTEAAHELKSGSLSIGVHHLSKLLSEIEQKARDGEMDDIELLVDSLFPAYEQVCLELRQLVN